MLVGGGLGESGRPQKWWRSGQGPGCTEGVVQLMGSVGAGWEPPEGGLTGLGGAGFWCELRQCVCGVDSRWHTRLLPPEASRQCLPE